MFTHNGEILRQDKRYHVPHELKLAFDGDGVEISTMSNASETYFVEGDDIVEAFNNAVEAQKNRLAFEQNEKRNKQASTLNNAFGFTPIARCVPEPIYDEPATPSR